MTNKWMEALVREHFGSDWAEDAKLREFVSAIERAHESNNSSIRGDREFKDQFIAAVSHELRTPLNPILALSQSMNSGVYGQISLRQQQALDHIEQNARHLHLLIEDILDFNEFECGDSDALTYDPVRGHEVLSRLRTKYQLAAETKGLQIGSSDSSGIEDHFYIDSRRVEKMVGLLLDNAIKFTPSGGRISIELAADRHLETLSFSVTDTGIGISGEAQAKLFQSFGQIDRGLSRAYNGAGIGLALVRRLSVHHGGSVDVESREGEGSRFTITLPLINNMKAVRDLEILNN